MRLISLVINGDLELMSANILDRVVPYLMHMTGDSNSRVRREAIDILTQVMSQVEEGAIV